MTRFALPTLLLLAALGLPGCADDYEVGTDYRLADEEAPPKAEAEAPESAAPIEAPETPPPADAPAPSTAGAPAGESGAGRPNAGRAGPSPSTAPPSASVKLSAGVALPQSLPIGTVMAFSVDYRFTGGGQRGSSYVWVIVPEKGQPVRQPVQLKPHGTLQGFFELRPENGPFKSHIEDAQGTRISPSVPMASASL